MQDNNEGIERPGFVKYFLPVELIIEGDIQCIDNIILDLYTVEVKLLSRNCL